MFFLFSCNTEKGSTSFVATWPDAVIRTWLGPDFWANRLQDWEISNGRVECLVANSNRNVNLFTCELTQKKGRISVSSDIGILADIPASDKNWVGFRLGAKGQFNDYRDNAIFGQGLNVGITTSGDLFIGAVPVKLNGKANALIPFLQKGIHLSVEAIPDKDNYLLKLSALDLSKQEVLAVIEKEINANDITGSMALVSHFPNVPESRDIRSCWFDNWIVSGSKVAFHPERAFGPILFSQYTLSRGILKITAQMPPVSDSDGDKVFLQIKKGNKWEIIGESTIDPLARTATITISEWDYKNDIPYKLSYTYVSDSGEKKDVFREGTIRKEPLGKNEVVIAGFTGNNDLGFPNQDILDAIEALDPDLLFFSGDQIYEGVGGFGFQRAPLDKSVLDYLRKWYLYGWAYGDLFRDRPCISIPDDHDVYQGNIWGAGGIAATPDTNQSIYQRSGGYRMPPEWVKMVERTQTSHLPSPQDPSPVAQGIGVYFSELNYGGVSFAILEDRKFKSGPLQVFPEALKNNKWSWNPEWDTNRAGAILLGERQLQFLDNWAKDWSNHTWMKVVLSQTIFAAVNTKSKTDPLNAQRRKVLKEGEYPADDVPTVDFDTNGWPQTGRNKAIKVMRKAFAFHLAGDQHLGSTIQYGVDEFGDAGYAFCVPSISNIWPRRWFPLKSGVNHTPGTPKYTGGFFDGFGNRMTVFAVSNPVFTGEKPAKLYDRATGYGIVRFNKNTRDIKIECWPRQANPKPDSQYPGWPITINQEDNFLNNATLFLPELNITGMDNPVVQIIDEANNEIVYTLRIKGKSYQPKVLKEGVYTIKIGELGSDLEKILNHIPSTTTKTDILKVDF